MSATAVLTELFGNQVPGDLQMLAKHLEASGRDSLTPESVGIGKHGFRTGVEFLEIVGATEGAVRSREEIEGSLEEARSRDPFLDFPTLPPPRPPGPSGDPGDQEPGVSRFPGIVLPWGKNGEGLKSRKQWGIELCCCDGFGRKSAAVVRLATGMYEPWVNTEKGTFFLGSTQVAKWTGWDRKSIDEWRDCLRNTGWIVDTGVRARSNAIIWRVEVPACQCGRHGIYRRT